MTPCPTAVEMDFPNCMQHCNVSCWVIKTCNSSARMLALNPCTGTGSCPLQSKMLSDAAKTNEIA